MDIDIVTVPYHLDRERQGTGLGPERLLDAGVEQASVDSGHTQPAVKLARLVRASRESGAAPLVLAGDCNNAIGRAAAAGVRLLRALAPALRA